MKWLMRLMNLDVICSNRDLGIWLSGVVTGQFIGVVTVTMAWHFWG